MLLVLEEDEWFFALGPCRLLVITVVLTFWQENGNILIKYRKKDIVYEIDVNVVSLEHECKWRKGWKEEGNEYKWFRF